jgi:hypothetical protein
MGREESSMDLDAAQTAGDRFRLAAQNLTHAQLESMSTIRELRAQVRRNKEQLTAQGQRIADLQALVDARDAELWRLRDELATKPARVTHDAAGLAMEDGWGARFELRQQPIEWRSGEFVVAASCRSQRTHMCQFESERRTEWRFLTNLGRLGNGSTTHHRGQHGVVSTDCACGELRGPELPLTEEYVELAGLMRGLVKVGHPECFVGDAWDEASDELGGLMEVFAKYHQAAEVPSDLRVCTAAEIGSRA